MPQTSTAEKMAEVTLFPAGKILIGLSDTAQYLHLTRANRHGLIAGATGTGKTVTLQTLAEGFSAQGVPVFMADVKGDLSGIAQPCAPNSKAFARATEMGLTDFAADACPTVFWDVFGTSGHPMRITLSELGAPLLSRLLELSDAQTGVLTIAFAYADAQGLLLLDLSDLQALLIHVAEHAKELSTQYGNISAATVNAITRKLLQLEQEGAKQLFGEPALDIQDLLRCDKNGRGIVHILSADVLIQKPRMYATLLLWLLSELFETLPEAGDLDKPKLVFFFDEAHLLFDDAEKSLLQKIEQVVRLIRSKGVGVYFITQQPQDIPNDVLAQLSNRVQHALRAFTPQDKKAVKAAAETFRSNPAFDTETVITTLAVGEALVSFLEADGAPAIVTRTKIRPPVSRIGAISPEERKSIISRDAIGDTYDIAINRESAYEKLTQRRVAALSADHTQEAPALQKTRATSSVPRSSNSRQTQGLAEQLAKAAVRSASTSIGRQIGNQIIRGILGSILRR